MNRREFGAALLAAAPPAPNNRLDIPVLRVMDRYARCGPGQRARFFSNVWDEAVRVFAKGDMHLRPVDRPGEVLQYPSGRPLFRGLDRTAINVVLTDRVPADWDQGRSLAGVSAIYEGICVSVISMQEAHGNQIPFLAVNTVVHELMHVLLGDVFSPRTGSLQGQVAEARADFRATALWLFGDGGPVRDSARRYLARLRTPVAPPRFAAASQPGSAIPRVRNARRA